MGVITIRSELCKECYSCVRNCPVKAIKVEDGKARVVEERCIGCGICIKVCSQKAKIVQRDVEKVKRFLAGDKAIALVAPSIPAAFPEMTPAGLKEILKSAGFSAVHEATLGVEATLPLYRELLTDGLKPVISTYCPAIVGLVTKYYPDLVPNLAPIDSAASAAAKIVASEYPGAKIVFIGPCIAKKNEMEKYGGQFIDAVLTFKELKEFLQESGLYTAVNRSEPGPDEAVPAYLPEYFPISGGLAMNLGGNQEDFMVVDGAEACLESLQSLRTQTEKPHLLDILFCKGCIDGPEVDSPVDLYGRMRAIQRYSRLSERDCLPAKYPKLDFQRSFQPESLASPQPSEKELRDILKFTYKNSAEDELNCGACGYNTCREKAVAVYQGLAEIDMCLPYLISKSRGETQYYKDRLEVLLGKKQDVYPIIGEHKSIIEAKRLAERSAGNGQNTIIQGEGGVGKRLLAQAIHALSVRRTKPFLEVDCSTQELLLEAELFGYEEGGFPQAPKGMRGGQGGKLEQARGGIVFLKHVEELPGRIQTKLLQALQEREFTRMGGNRTVSLDVRLISSTRVDLRKMVSAGIFRADLFYRLDVVHIFLTPLRERGTDIQVLTGYFLETIALEKNLPPRIFADKAMDALFTYTWPGNIRELYNVVQRALFISEDFVIGLEQLPPNIQRTLAANTSVPNFDDAVARLEKELIIQALQATNNNRVQASKLLKIPRATLYIKLKEYQIDI